VHCVRTSTDLAVPRLSGQCSFKDLWAHIPTVWAVALQICGQPEQRQ
jgi:hypothetical protein